LKKEKIKNIEKVVETILRNDELARRDDNFLILQVVRELYPFEVGKTFASVMFNAKNKGISFETITRARRKLQNKYPELKEKEIAKVREKEQSEYIEYAKESV